MPVFTMQRRVQFADTDMAGIVHFANFYRYMEETEHAYFRSLGLFLMDVLPDGSAISWPRVKATCNFESPARYDDVLNIELGISRLGTKSLTLTFQFRLGERRVATGELTTVCCHCRHGEPMEPIVIPPDVRQRFQPAVERQ